MPGAILLALTPKNNGLIVLDSSDHSKGAIWIVDIESGRRMSRILADVPINHRPCLSEDRRICVYAPFPSNLLWFADLETGREWKVGLENKSGYYSFEFSQNNDKLCLLGDGSILVLDIPAEKIRSFPRALSAGISPDGNQLMRVSGQFRSGLPSGPGQADLLDLKTDKVLLTVPFESEPSFRFSPDGQHIAVSVDSRLELWNVQERKCLMQWDKTTSFNFSPDSQFLAVVGSCLRVYELPSTKEVWNTEGTAFPYFSADAKRLIVRDRAIHFHDASTGRLRFSIESDASKALMPGCSSAGHFECITIRETANRNEPNAFEKFLFDWFRMNVRFGTDVRNHFVVVDANDSRVVSRLDVAGNSRVFVHAFITPDAGTLFVADEGYLRCWDVPTGTPWLWILGPPLALAAAPFAWKYRPWRRAKSSSSPTAVLTSAAPPAN
ncbi:MAG: WD40 repeat domain-containing protein [Planctomycetes bacterium]|nr:WD40 repeat domain-containing protein [Planctomycetota bacterium]